MSAQRKVTIYGNRTCTYCGAARMLLTRKGVTFEDIIVTDDDALKEEMIQRSGGRTVPQVFIGDTAIGGFAELCELDKSGELDNLLAE